MRSTIENRTNMNHKINLQKHRIRAFHNTLGHLESYLQRRIKFIEDYQEVYNFPASIARNNIREYRRHLKAVQQLKTFKNEYSNNAE